MMARFWKRGTDGSVERLMRANRPVPKDDFVSSLLHRIESETPRRRVSAQRYRLALVMAVLLVALAAALGGITAASAGVGKIVHAATNVVTPSGTDNSSSGKQSTVLNTSSNNVKTNINTTNSTDNNKKDDGDDQGSSGDEQYLEAICDVEGSSGRVVLKYLSPSAVQAHLSNGGGDYLPINCHC